MEKFLMVLGSNWQLSLAELDNVLKYSRFKGKILDYSANIAIVEFDKLHSHKHYINELMEFQYILGGIQKVAKVFEFIHIHDVLNAFPIEIKSFKRVQTVREKISRILSSVLDKIFFKIKNESIFYAISIYPNLFEEEYYSKVLIKHFLPYLNTEIMKLLREKGVKKALYYQYPEEYIDKGTLNPIFPHHIIKYGLFNKDRAEIVFGFTEEGVYVARTFTCDDPNFKKKVDEERPFKEFRSSISPKLSLIMLNFLNLFHNRHNKTILDPFVGNGTILMFALIQDFLIYGSDIDKEKVNNTIRNINWLLNELEEPIPLLLKEKIVTVEVQNLSNVFKEDFFDGIISEPELGPFYRERPYYTEIKELIKAKLKPIYESMFKEGYKILKEEGRICVIAPIFETIDGGDVQLNVEKIANFYNFKLIPLLDPDRIINKSNVKLQFQKNQVKTMIDAKKEQIVKRKIYLFEKVKN
ncbi:MAG: TRM11 family SAM-dependent methyltransferase [Candidatus Hodarchaeota archaeon]